MNASQVASAWERSFDMVGEVATLRRPGETPTNCSVRIKPIRMSISSSNDEVGAQSVSMGRRVLILQADIVSGSFPEPIKSRQDQLIWNDRTYTIMIPDDDGGRRVGGVTMAVEVEVSG